MNLRQTTGLSEAINSTMKSLSSCAAPKEKTLPAEFTIKVANTLEDRLGVFELAYQVYLEKGYVKENANKFLVLPYDADPETVVLVVKDQNKKVAGSLSLVFSNSTRLPSEKIYGQEIRSLKAKGERCVEISRLVVSHEYRNSKEVLRLLINYLMIYSYHVKNYSSLVIEVNPRHRAYYKELLSFDVIGEEKECPMVQNAPAVLLHLPLARYQSEVIRFANNFDQNKKERSLYSQFLRPEQESLVAHYLQKQVKPITSEEKAFFGFAESGFSRAVCV